MTGIKWVGVGVLGLSGLFGLTSVQAEDGVNRVFEEVVVTARKREETAQSVPIPITALGAEQMQTRNMTEIRDIERLSPNTDIDYSAVRPTGLPPKIQKSVSMSMVFI